MERSEALSEFQNECQRYYICYVLASFGLKSEADRIENLDPDRSKNMNVGVGHPDEGNWHGSMNIGELIDSSQKSGRFSSEIAKSFICIIYALWDELYRKKIASEADCENKQITSELMGDLRHIRHCVIHKQSVISSEAEKLKELQWSLEPGHLVITEVMFQTLISQINHMLVKVELA